MPMIDSEQTERKPQLPPVYLLHQTAGGDPTAAAIDAGRLGAEEGALFWDETAADLRCALLLHPDTPLEGALPLLTVASVGVGDALAALTPPQLPLSFGWPNRILLNDGTVGRLFLTVAEAPSGTIPAWLALTIEIDMVADWDNDSPGARADVTNLWEEGADDITQIELLEAISRHLLSWMARWQSEEGLAPALASWTARAKDQDRPLTVTSLRLAGVLR
jgi:BirA family biotin operon repressor/biotin-[acetyl-CoA-carboxylase] ligase